MGKAGLILGKMLQGVADVAVPAAMQERKAEIQAMRDKTLQGYAMEQQAAQNAAATQRQEAGFEHDASMQQGDQTFRKQQQEAGFTHAENMQDDAQQAALEVMKRNQEFLKRFDAMDTQERNARMGLLGQQLANAGYDGLLKQLQLGTATAEAELRKMMMPGYKDPETGKLLTKEAQDQAFQTYFILNPDAREKVTIFQPKDEYGNYLQEPWIFEGTQRVAGPGMTGANPTWFLQPGAIKSPMDYRRALEAIRTGMDNNDFTRTEAQAYANLIKQMRPAQDNRGRNG